MPRPAPTRQAVQFPRAPVMQARAARAACLAIALTALCPAGAMAQGGGGGGAGGSAPFVQAGVITVGAGPEAMALTDRLLVCAGEAARVTEVDPVTQQVSGAVSTGKTPASIAVYPGGRLAAVACLDASEVDLIDLDHLAVRARRAVPQIPRAMVLLPGLRRLLVSGYYAGTVTALDAQTLDPIGTIPAGQGVYHLAATPDEKTVYAMDGGSDRVYVIDPATVRLRSIIQEGLGSGQWDMRMSGDGTRLVISNWSSNSLTVIDAVNATVLGQVPTGGKGAAALSLSDDGRLALVSHSEDNSVALVDVRAMRLVSRVAVGRFPFSCTAISPDRRWGLVTNDKDGTVSVLSMEPLREVARVATGPIPRTILFTADSRRAYVANTDADTVSVLDQR